MAARKQPIEALSQSEQPYEVPNNWIWTRLGGCITRSKEKALQPDSSMPYVGLDNMQSGFGIVEYIEALGLKSEKNVFHPGQILYGRLRPYLNKHDVAQVEGMCSTDILVYDVEQAALPKYINYFMNMPYFIAHSVEHSKGINLPRVSSHSIEELAFPLPPLEEQQRIVERIENLFSKLDDVETQLHCVIEESRLRQAAIIGKAFAGNLSNTGEKWEQVKVLQVVEGLKYGTSEKSDYNNDGLPVLRIPNVSQSRVDLDDMKFLSHCDVKPDDLLHEDDILMIRSNGSRDLVGRCAIVPKLDGDYTYASFLIRIRPSENVVPRYLWYYLQSSEAKSQLFNRAKSSSGIHNINSKEIGSTLMPLPPLGVQEQIVQYLDSMLEKEDEFSASVQNTLNTVSTIRQAILAKAMRGELGTNNPDDVSALELLAQM